MHSFSRAHYDFQQTILKEYQRESEVIIALNHVASLWEANYKVQVARQVSDIQNFESIFNEMVHAEIVLQNLAVFYTNQKLLSDIQH